MTTFGLRSLPMAVKGLLFFMPTIFMSTMVEAARCVAVFPTVLSSPLNSGQATFEGLVTLSGTDGTLDIGIASDGTSVSDPSCETQKCVDSTKRAQLLTLPVFQQSTSSQDYAVNDADFLNLPQGSYDQINLNYQASVRFTQNNNITFIKHLNANRAQTTVIFEEGVYWIDNFEIEHSSNIEINGSDKVTLIINHGNFDFSGNGFNSAGTADQLTLISYNDIRLGYQAQFNGFIYADGAVELDDQVNFKGAINASNITLEYNSTVTYAPESIESANFNGFCSANSMPIANYQFDEVQYNDADNEVIDSIGGFHGRAKFAQPVEGKVCHAVDLSYSGTDDYVILDENILNNKTDFSVSVWAKTLKKSNQSILSGAASSRDNELLMWFTNDRLFTPFIKNTPDGDINITSMADDAWHHLVWTRSGEQSCLYQDNVLQGCLAQTSGELSIQSLILGQEQDNVGGGFADIQAFDGLLDELLVFDTAISSTEIASIYQNQNAGLSYDGNVVSCPDLPPELPTMPIASYQFDEQQYNDVDNEVIDSIGGFNGRAKFAQPAKGKICNAVDLSATGTSDYVILDENILNRTKNFSVSLWAKTSKQSAQSLLSGATSGSNNELIMWFTEDTQFRPYLKDTFNGNITSSTIADGGWHHLVWTREGSQSCLYRDKALQGCANQSGNPLSIKSLILGQEQDSIGGGFDAAQAFNGLIDELMVFNGAITDAEITKLYDNQNIGLDYDGSLRSCSSPIPIANYRLDEQVWAGAAGEVIDETGNFHAQPINGAITKAENPAITGNPGTCRYGSFDGVNDYLALPDSFDNLQGSFTVTAWINPSNVNAGSRIFIDDEERGQRKGFGFSLGDGGGGRLRFYSRNVNPIIVDTTTTITPNIWTFVAAVHNSETKTRQIFINGVAQTVTGGGTSNTYTGTWGTDDGPATIGGETDLGETGNRFTGGIDEVRIYKGALSEKHIADIFSETHFCSVPFVHHYEIIHDGQGLTCDVEPVTIKACMNADCTLLSTDSVKLNLMVGGELVSSPTFTGGTTVSFNHTVVETLALSIDAPSITPSSPTVCNNGSRANCNIAFTDAGFRFLSGASNSITLPNQTAGTRFAEALKLQAVKNDNGVCTGLFTGNKNINLSQENIDPSGISGLSFNINGDDIGKHPSTTNITLNFGTDSIATIPQPVYHDAGKISLHANYNLDGVNVSGTSNAFWVSPAELAVFAKEKVNSTSLNGASATTGVKHKAGNDFELSVAAYNSEGVITPNYIPGQIQFKLARTGPTLANSVDGKFTYALGKSLNTNISPEFQNVTLTDFNAGVSRYEKAQYSEVGLLNLAVQDSNYGQAGIIVPATRINIGRFIPDHFKQTIADDGAFWATCNSGTTFAYSGQKDEATNAIGAISYLNNPVFEITAYNKQGSITQNYYQDSEGSSNDYMKLSSASVRVALPTTDQVALGIDLSLLPITANMYEGTLSQNDLTMLPNIVSLPKGVLHYQLSSSDNFFYQRSANAVVKQFNADIDFAINTIVDTDLVDLTMADGTSSTDTASPTGVEIRFSRLVLENSFGPETSNFPQPMQVEYFDGTNFIDSKNDNCSTYDSTKVELRNISLDPDLVDVLGGSGTFVNGKTQAIELKAPGAGKQGEIGVIYHTYDWLKYDWDDADDKNDGPYDDDPSAVAAFGLFRGNDRIIYWQETFN